MKKEENLPVNMENDPQTIKEETLPANATVFTQTGDKNMQIAHATNVNNVTNIIVPTLHQRGGVVNTTVTLSTEYYNLFVLGDETFSNGYFNVPKDRALTEHMSPETIAQFSSLSENSVSFIKTLPSLFASENHQYGKTDADHQAYFGIVTDVKIQDNGIKVHFNVFSAIPQQRLNEFAFELAIRSASSYSELNRTHWAIKKINLMEELRAAGISVLAPT